MDEPQDGDAERGADPFEEERGEQGAREDGDADRGAELLEEERGEQGAREEGRPAAGKRKGGGAGLAGEVRSSKAAKGLALVFGRGLAGSVDEDSSPRAERQADAKHHETDAVRLDPDPAEHASEFESPTSERSDAAGHWSEAGRGGQSSAKYDFDDRSESTDSTADLTDDESVDSTGDPSESLASALRAPGRSASLRRSVCIRVERFDVDEDFDDWQVVAWDSSSSEAEIGALHFSVEGLGEASFEKLYRARPRTREEWVEVELVDVRKDYRNLGVGTLLLRAALAHASDLGATAAFLAVLDGAEKRNTAARALYRKLGFEDMEAHFEADRFDPACLVRSHLHEAATDFAARYGREALARLRRGSSVCAALAPRGQEHRPGE